jgi:multiple antibiotic resistance protein
MHPHTSTRKLIRDSLIIAWWVAIVLTGAALFGELILSVFGLEIEYFRIAWWCVIWRVARNLAQWNLSAITLSESKLDHHKQRKLDQGLIIPLVMPMTAGPGSIAYIISQTSSYDTIPLIVAIGIASIVVYIAIRYGSAIIQKLWDNGIIIMTRLLGMILLGVALQMSIGTILTLI